MENFSRHYHEENKKKQGKRLLETVAFWFPPGHSASNHFDRSLNNQAIKVTLA
jgi:hypothetical protein